MAKQVENRVVEMEFKNKDFEKAVAVTLDSIEKLNKKLDSLNDVNVKGFDNIAKAANRIDFSGAFAQIDELSDRFTTITGKIKSQLQDWVIEDIIKKPLAQLEKTADSVMNTIVTKGKNRSKNLAQAKFQLEALGVAWEQVYDDMDYAVTGTAYGIDEAAMAASQFAASNVKLGKDMKAALRGISGVAAMTGRSYTEIAQIFTTVAGTGRAMNGELNRIAERGLNAKKAISDYMNKLDEAAHVTQNDVEQMARKGQISFEIFSKAMDEAFGEHSTKANELFVGAFDNTAAALGRIGERFSTPIYEDLRQMLVALIPVINDFKKSLDPVVESVTEVTNGIRALAVSVLENIHGAFKKDDERFTIDLFGKTIDSKQILMDFLYKVADAISGIGRALKDEDGTLSLIGQTLQNTFWNVYQIIKAIKDGIGEIFDAPTMNDVKSFVEKIKDLSEKFKMSEKTANKLKRVIAGLAAIFDIIGKTVSAVWKVIIEPLFDDIARLFGKAFTGIADLADKIVAFDKNYQPFSNLFNKMQDIWPYLFSVNRKILEIYETIKTKFVPYIQKAFGKVKELFQKVKEGLSQKTGIDSWQTFFEKLNSLAEKLHVTDIFMGIAGAIKFAYDQLVNFIDLMSGSTEFKEYVGSIKESSIMLTWISEKIEAIKKTWHELWSGNITLTQALGLDKLAEKFEWVQVIIDKFKEHYKSIFETEGAEPGPESKIKEWSDRLKKALQEMDFQEVFSMMATAFYTYFAAVLMKHRTDLVDSVKGLVDELQGSVSKISDALTGATEGVQENKLLSIGKGLALIAASIFMIALIPEADLDRALGAVMELMLLMAAIFVVMGLVFNRYRTMQTQAASTGVMLLEDHGGAQGGLGGFFGRLGGGISSLCDGISYAMTDLAKAPAMMVAFGAAIFLLASSIYRLKDIDPDKLLAGLLAIETLMITMGVIMTKMRTPDTAGLAAVFIAMSVAIAVMVNTMLLFCLLPADKMLQAVGGMGMVMLLLVVLYAVVTSMSKFALNGPGMLAAAGSMIMMALAVQMIMVPIMLMCALPEDKMLQAVGAMGILLLMLASMAAFAAGFGALGGAMVGAVPGMLAGAGAVMIMSMALTTIMIPISVLTALVAKTKPGVLDDAIRSLELIMVAMSLMAILFGIIGGVTGGVGAAGMLAGAASMMLMATALTAILVPLNGMAALQASGNFEAAFVALTDCLILLAIAAGVAIPLGPGLAILCTVIISLAGSVFLIGAAVFAAGNGVLAFITALSMMALFDWQQLAENIVKNGTVIKAAILTLIGGALEALIESTDMAVEAAVIMLVDVCKGIEAHAEEIGYYLGSAVTKIVAYAITGVLGGVGDLFTGLIGKIAGVDIGKDDPRFSDWLKQAVGLSDDTLEKTGEDAGGGLFKAIQNGIFKTGGTDDIAKTVDGNAIGEAVGADAADGFNSSLMGGIEGMSAGAGADYADEFWTEFDEGSNTPSVLAKRDDAVTSFNAGAAKALSEDTQLSDAATENCNGAIDASAAALSLKNGYSMKTFEQGEMLDKGWAEGLFKNQFFEKAMADKDAAALKIHRTDFNMHSPSKVMMENGENIDKGLAIGLTNSDASEQAMDNKSHGLIAMISSISDFASSSVNTNGLDSISQAISSIASSGIENADLNPTITPVLDLSDVNNGFSTLDSMFASSRSLQLAGEASSLQEASRSLNLKIQNDNRNNNFNALGTKIDRLGDALLNRHIYLDSGELVGGMINPMDRALGVRAIRAQRGGAR